MAILDDRSWLEHMQRLTSGEQVRSARAEAMRHYESRAEQMRAEAETDTKRRDMLEGFAQALDKALWAENVDPNPSPL